jgi:hypothetical protein
LSNPYAFYRSWQVNASTNVDNTEMPLHHLHDTFSIQRMMDERMKKIENQFSSIAEMLESKRGRRKGTGRGKSSKNICPKTSEPIQSTSQGCRNSRAGSLRGSQNDSLRREATNRLKDFMGERTSANSDIFTDDASDISQQDLKTIFIQKVDCQFNGNSLDSIEDKSTEDETMQQFWRMYYMNGQLTSLFSNGLTYNDFW